MDIDVLSRDIYGRTIVHRACFSGDIKTVTELMLQADVRNAVEKEDRFLNVASPLHWACYGRKIDVVKFLVEVIGMDVNLPARYGETPLVWACTVGNSCGDPCDDAVLVRYLLEKGADPFKFSPNKGVTPIHIASSYGLVNSVKVFLDFYPELVSIRSYHNGMTPLHYAVSSESYDTAKILLERGADVNCPDDRGCTPVWLMCEKGTIGGRLWDLLLEYGGNLRSCAVSPHEVLRVIADMSSSDVEKIKELGLDVNNLTDKNGRNALHCLCLCPRGDLTVTVMKKLFILGADPNALTCDGETPLDILVDEFRWKKHREIVEAGVCDVIRELIKYGADPNTAGADGNTPLHRACRYRLVPIIETLLEEGADMDARNKLGETPRDILLSVGLDGIVRKGIARKLVGEGGIDICYEDALLNGRRL
ncbi:MAG: ankyrin repeat domain-containing protein [Candidatus Methanomethylicaceae archaeon]